MPDLARRDLLLLAPIMPAASGNGLAMRVGAQLEALSAVYDVRLVVVPVAGGWLNTTWADRQVTSVAVVQPDDPAELRAGAARLMTQAAWRARLQGAEPFPDAVRYASPALAARVAEGAGNGGRVHAVRAYLAPLAVAVAELIGAAWATLDLDDDDERLLEAAGHHEEAAAYGRILSTFGPAFAWTSLASPGDADRVARRHGLRTAVIPNSVRLGLPRARPARAPGQGASLLFVGNLTYPPNAEAAEELAAEILPRVRRLLDRPVVAELIGAFEPGGQVEALSALEGVRVRGHVAELDEAYAHADVAVVPLAHGAGTRIKLLEAFALGVPVVTTPVGAEGLAAEHGRHLLIGRDADQLATAVARLLLDGRLAAELAREARAFVEQRYGSDVVARQIRALAQALDAPRSGHEAPGGEI